MCASSSPEASSSATLPKPNSDHADERPSRPRTALWGSPTASQRCGLRARLGRPIRALDENHRYARSGRLSPTTNPLVNSALIFVSSHLFECLFQSFGRVYLNGLKDNSSLGLHGSSDCIAYIEFGPRTALRTLCAFEDPNQRSCVCSVNVGSVKGIAHGRKACDQGGACGSDGVGKRLPDRRRRRIDADRCRVPG